MKQGVCIFNWLPHEHVLVRKFTDLMWYCTVDGCRYFILEEHLHARLVRAGVME